MEKKTIPAQVQPVVICEWGFDVPPEHVDLDLLWTELIGIPAIVAFSYLAELRNKAPQTYARLRTKRLAEGCTIFNWVR